jgi:MFS family permease
MKLDDLTSKQYDEYVSRNAKWNFFANAADLSAVNLAKAFVFSTTILPIYASHLTNSSVLIGFIPAILEVGFLLPQIFIARRAETFDRMKPFVVRVSVWERMPYLFLALSVFLWPNAPSWFAYGMLALNIAIASGSGGIATPAWKTMLGKVIHKNSRGLLFALGVGIGGFLGIGGSVITRYLLTSFTYPRSYAYCFALAFAGQAISWIFLTLNREPPRAMSATHTSFREYIRELPPILKGDRNFSKYLFGQLFMILSMMASTFFVLYGKLHFGITDEYAATLTMIALISQSAGTPVIGWVSDRLGHKLMSEFSAIIGIVSLVIALVAPTPAWLAVTFVLANLARIAMLISRTSITMEFSPLEKMPTYTALSGTLLAVPTFLAPVFGGWLIDLFSYKTTFVVAICFALVGLFVSTRGVSDPRINRGNRTKA